MSDQQFDIIIVGGGTAGCVLAFRLSANANLRILLLEAGSDRNEDPKVKTPLTSRQMFKDSDYDWDYRTEPQIGLENRVIEHTRGRMLGGSSAINSHSLVFPNRDMHDTWAEMIKDDRWSWAQIKDCYAQFYQELPSSTSSGTTEHPCTDELSKPIKASYPRRQNHLQIVWEDVFKALGRNSANSGVSGNCIGGFTTTNAVDSRPGKGERSHAGNAYLRPALSRSNLIVETNALVERVTFETNSSSGCATFSATGVRYAKDGKKFFAKASREVIICAGTFGSPQILELSGIGKREILKNVGIECLLDLPGVGENLQDHLNFGPSVEVRSNIETLDAAVRDPTIMDAYREQYLKSRDGPLSEGGAYSFAFWPLQLFNTASEEIELQHLLDGYRDASTNKSRRQHEDFIRRMVLSPHEASATVFMIRTQRHTSSTNRADGNYMSVIAMLAHPFSRGTCHIISADARDHPKIDCAYLSHPLDAEILARHCLQIERLLKQPTYAEIIKKGGNRLPREYGKENHETLDEVKSVMKKYAATNYHPCGTCAMMSRADGGVVDGNLRVYGTTNVRICDASVFPIIPRGNILTTVYAVAEKAAEIILREFKEGP